MAIWAVTVGANMARAAGLHTPGKHYMARAANIRTYTEGRFDPVGQLDETVTPIDEMQRYAPGEYDSGDELPKDTSRLGLLVLPDDLTSERSELQTQPFHAAVGFASDAVADRDIWSMPVQQFRDAALRDAQSRVESHYNVDVALLDGCEPIAACVQWCQQHHLQGVVVLKPTQGPWAELCTPLTTRLRENGTPLLQVRRQWDKALHPHATKGYFTFKQQIPRLLKRWDHFETDK